jgi:hypothetical protein
MHHVRAAKSNEDFDHPKCTQGIRVTNPFVKQALVAAALDRAVTAIDLLPPAYVPPGCREIIVIHRDDGRFVLDVVAGRPIIDVDARRLLESALPSLRIASIVLRTADFRQPRFAVAEGIWRFRGLKVPLDFRMQVQMLLRDGGSLTIGELLARVRGEGGDPLAMICALACADEITLDIDAPFSLATTVGARR